MPIDSDYSARGLLMRIAAGEFVSPAEARRCLLHDRPGSEATRRDRVRARKVRDQALRAAAVILSPDRPCEWERAKRPAQAIKRFEGRL